MLYISASEDQKQGWCGTVEQAQFQYTTKCSRHIVAIDTE